MQSYHKRTLVDWIVMLAVAINAGVIIYLSYGNTAKMAESYGLPPWATAFLVEILFALLLILRSRQRALKRNVPWYVDLGYFVVFLIVTRVNTYGLSLKNPDTAIQGGLMISGTMFLLELILVWLFTKSHKPYRKSVLRQKLEAFIEAWELKTIQEIEWIKYNALRPNTKLVKKVRKSEQKRKKIIGDDLPEFFLYLEKQDRIKEIVAELHETEPRTIDVQDEQQETAIVPLKKRTRPIGFHVEMSNTESPVFSTIEHPSNTPKSNTQKRQTSNTKKHQSLTKKEQAIQYVIGLIERNEDYSVTSVANTVGCARSTASLAIREAKEKIGEVKN